MKRKHGDEEQQGEDVQMDATVPHRKQKKQGEGIPNLRFRWKMMG